MVRTVPLSPLDGELLFAVFWIYEFPSMFSDPSFAATRLRDSRKLETVPTFNLVYAAQSVTRGVF